MKQSPSSSSSREGFGSFFGILVAAAGSAVGLGNLWRFPYMVGSNGGAAFILVYLGFVVFICLSVMLAEFIIGRRSQSNVMDAFTRLGAGKSWKVVGYISLLASVCILAFYSVVGGWTMDYLFNSIIDLFRGVNIEEIESEFVKVTTSTARPIIWTLIFLAISALIVGIGIEKGIEKYSKILMPILFLMVILVAIRSITLPGSAKGLAFLFNPDFSHLTPKSILAALGQSFFSLSLGMGCMITYGSYIRKKENLSRLSFSIVIADTLFAILAGMAIMPAVFAFGISPGQGPALVFITLPHIFAQIPLGSVFAIFFFAILFIAAITSAISLLEVVTAYAVEHLKIKRKTAVSFTFAIIAALGILSSLSQGELKDVLILGKTFFDMFDYLSANILLPLGGLLIVAFVGWRLPKTVVKDEISNSGSFACKLFPAFRFVLRYVAPIAIIIVLLSALELI